MSEFSIRVVLAADATTAESGTAGTEATVEHHGSHNSFYGDKNELYWGTASFLIILALFVWKGVPLIKKAAATRIARISDEIAGAEAGKAAAETELAALKVTLGNAAADAEAIIIDARARAHVVKADLVARSEAEIDDAKQRARIEIEASKQQAFADLQAEVASMTVIATQAVVHENLTDAVQVDLIEQFISQLGATR
jgi:F-type H+-transporting ATPase subunit b